MILTELRLRTILDSRAELTVEADVCLDAEFTGRGSSARAIAPGRREPPRARPSRLGPAPLPDALATLVGRPVEGQRALDAELVRGCRSGTLGADQAVAVSLAYARACSAAIRRPLVRVLAEQAGTQPRIPALLVNVFSGGIHGQPPPRGFQQVMAMPASGSLLGDIIIAREVFAAAEELCLRRFAACPLSDSSGLLAPVDSIHQLDLLADAIDAAGHGSQCAMGVDVAAEHLIDSDHRYRFGDAVVEVDEFADQLAVLVDDYNIRYLEDPFDPGHDGAWRALRHRLADSVALVGDDLFATTATLLDPGLAGGVLIKLTQAGTVTAATDAAATARSAGMLVAVSHRSGETDDTGMVELAVALGADLAKVGGPRRGDRLANYNQLLRLAEVVGDRSHRPFDPLLRSRHVVD
jgi:enolase